MGVGIRKVKPENNSPYQPAAKTMKTSLHKLKSHFKSYCNYSGIHGFQYFGQDRTIIEKCWWIVVFIVILMSCGFSIYLIYNKWRQSPVIVSLTTKETPIHEIPFPAVTICPTIKSSKKCINFSSYLEGKKFGPSIRRNEYVQFIALLCQWGNLQNNSSRWKENYSDEIYKIFLKCSPYLESEMSEVHEITFMGEKLNFQKDFRPVITEDGLCFSFNMLSSKDIFHDEVYIHSGLTSSSPKSQWIHQHGYEEKAGLHTYPRRALWSGVANSLNMTFFHRKSDIDHGCTGALQGYKVNLHFPTKIARSIYDYTVTPFGKVSMISVKAERMTASEAVKKYSARNRKCYFGEKNLKFFKIYTSTNCVFECLTNFTLKKCGCVAFYMPRTSSTPICGLPKWSCVGKAREKYLLSNLESKLKAKISKPNKEEKEVSFLLHKSNRQKRKANILPKDTDEKDARCHCMRDCSDITYTTSATVLDFNWGMMSMKHKDLNSTLYGVTQIMIYFGHNTIFTAERNELYGPTDFLSNFGGLLGLFTGFSILSLIEIIYFCTLRIVGNRKLFGRWYEMQID